MRVRMRTKTLEEAGPVHGAVPAASEWDMKGGEGVPLPLSAGSHCLLGEQGCLNRGRRVQVRAGGRCMRALLGALRFRGAHGVL